MTIGERIKQIRISKRISQTELADRINTTKQNIYKYENNIITNIPSDKIEAIAKVFNVTPAYLMGWEGKLDIFSLMGIQHDETLSSELADAIMKSVDVYSEKDIINYINIGLKVKPEKMSTLINIIKTVVNDWNSEE